MYDQNIPQQLINQTLDTSGKGGYQYQPYLSIPMRYQQGANNNQIGKARRVLTMKLVARFGLTSPTIVAWLYGIPLRLALEHLNKLVSEKLLSLVITHRSMDGRVYVLDYTGAKYAEELLSVAVYFRAGEPSLRVNQNTIMHDLMMQYVQLKGLHNRAKDNTDKPYWYSFVTEPEFKRLFKSDDVRNVDGIALEPDGTIAAIEIEHSFKTKAARQTILLKWLYGLKHGYYDKVMLFSQSLQIFNDIKRLHTQLLDEMPARFDKKTKLVMLSIEDAEMLRGKVVHRTVLCKELSDTFYS
ncbi:hypothetical protein L2729_11770 [Shewanella gelidimarina]|uniref:hypothetical protein n=1 Tax=Shewanella gelidimarina TaxID=56813 RepID=UPI00200F627C|nr:hypothetical protein [Shewanella gelidimarina]MCL1058664.1 hypothetical protein [Shewanella gelidimarina]